MTAARSPISTLRRRLIKWAAGFLFVVAAPLVLLISCQSQLIYFPRSYGLGTVQKWQRDTAGKTLD
jgi:hypothetical protein